MTILNTITETFYSPYWSNWFLLFIIPFLLGIYYIYRSFSGRRKSSKERKKLLIIGIIIMAICSSSLLACIFRSNSTEIKKYQVILNNEIDMRDFSERYEILEQQGITYIIVEKVTPLD